MLKSIYGTAHILIVMGLGFFTSYQLYSTFNVSWLAVGISIIPYMLFNFYLGFAKKITRLEKQSYVFYSLAFFSLTWSMFQYFNGSPVPESAFLVSFINLLAIPMHTKWQGKLSLSLNKDVADVGKQFPAIELVNEKNEKVNTKDLLHKPSIFMFYRGNWCPLCMAQIKEISGYYKELEERGIQTVLISPQAYENTRDLADQMDVNFIYLSDKNFDLAKKLDIVHKNAKPLGLPGYEADAVFPTVILTDGNGKIIHIDQTDNYLIRPEPQTFIAVFDQNKVNFELEQKVQQRTASIKELLDNTGEGFFSFGKDFSIHKNYSIACETFFGKTIKYADAVPLLFPKDIQNMRETFSLLFEGKANIDMLEPILPKEIEVNERFLSIQYRWIEHKEISDCRAMIILKDITKEVELREKVKAEEDFKNMLTRVISNKDDFISLVHDIDSALSKIEDEISEDIKKLDIKDALRQLHNLKGTTASFAMKEFAEKCHSIESLVQQDFSETAKFRDSLKNEIQELREILKDNLKDLESVIPSDQIGNHEKVYQVSKNELDSVSKKIEVSIPQDKVSIIQEVFDELKKEPVQSLFNKLEFSARDVAKKLNKRIKVEKHANNLKVNYEKYKDVFTSLIHLVRNSVDHGIEDFDGRISMDKEECGQLSFSANVQGDRLVLEFADDGKGIQTEKVKQIALDKKIISEEQVDRMNENEINSLIFEPSFSTKEEVSDISGRGVGMDAVKENVEKIGGKISVESIPEKGSKFTVNLPLF